MTAPQNLQTITATIAQELGETQRGPISQIRRTVQRLGPEAARAILQETQAIEAQGGLMLPDGSRRRTPGGVFFHLVRQRVTPDDRAFIFPGWPKRPTSQTGTAQAPAAQPSTPVVQPDTLPNLTGELRTVKITLIGRPGPIATSPTGTVTTTMQSRNVPALPRGVPAPPTTPTPFTVYIGPKQWAKVAAALRDPEDVLIIEGFPAADPARPGITVYATNVTTKLLQQAQRAAQQQGTSGP
ncbi:MAG: phosphorylated adapter RNA export RNA-binding domain-containing protein [Chloroflexota bacterium]|nr:phosphorylated adapter RNA export RNA-binding domain-containing protein [Chloroflexota bacterium]